MSAPQRSLRADARLAPRAEHLAAHEMSLIARDDAVSFRQANASPALMSIVEAKGLWLRDASGNRYRDFYGNNCHHIGHRHPRVVEAVHSQVDKLSFVARGLTSESSIQLAEQLVAHYPSPQNKVLFAPGGAAAIEIALMLAKVNTKRFKTISFLDSYHGRSAGALSVSGSPRDRSPRLGPLVPGAFHVPPFYWDARTPHATDKQRRKSALASLAAIEAVFEQEKDIAAFIAEPIRNGAHLPPPDYWPAVRALCDRFGTVLIFDDVPMGLGKTGKLFNCEHFGVLPDMTVIGKALGGAMFPLAAVIASDRLDTTEELNLSYYTHEKNPLSTAAGLATLSVIVEGDLPRQAARLGEIVSLRLQRLAERFGVIGNTRSIGLMFAVDLLSEDTCKTGEQLATDAFYGLLRRGILAMPTKGHTVSFSAPLNIEEHELEESLDILEQTIREVSGRAA